jgi:hypothetical protein
VVVQREKKIEEKFLRILGDHPEKLAIANSSSRARNIADLLGGNEVTVFHDTTDWNPHPKLMQDLVGGVTPDIVLRSKSSGQNRIYIEVKDTETLGYGIDDSQIVRYFLHLLAMTTKAPSSDIKRAVLLCAPSRWFQVEHNARTWNHFLDRFSGLAKAFDITLGELRVETF